MSAQVYDQIVIGAGIIGSWTAYHLAATGKQKVLLLEQFPLPHSRGSSHGQSRIYRAADADPNIVELVRSAKADWMELQDRCGEIIFHQTGRLTFRSLPNFNWLSKTENNLKNAKISHTRLSAKQLKQRYPMIHWNESYEAILERDSGILLADKCLKNLHSEFKKSGGTLRDCCPIKSITPGEIVTVQTGDGMRYRGRSLIIAAGTWMPHLLKTSLNLELPLHAETIAVCYWKIKDKSNVYNLTAGFPNFSSSDGKITMYGTPSFEYPGLIKACLHSGTPVANPEERDTVDISKSIKLVSDFIHEHFPYVDHTKPAIVERCMYTMTPDKGFITDVHPKYTNIVYGAGFSGGGFKASPAIGRILGYLSTKDPNMIAPLNKVNLDNFASDRFNKRSRL